MKNGLEIWRHIALVVHDLGRLLPGLHYKPLLATGYVSGGCFASIALGQPVKDYDIFVQDDKLAAQLRRYLVTRPDHLKIIAVTDRAVSFTSAATDKVYPYYQLITKYTGYPADIICKFDFVHCCPYYRMISDHVVYPSDWHKVVSRQILRVNETFDGTLSQERIKRFVKRGWVVETEEMRGLDLLARTALTNKDEDFLFGGS